MLKIALKAYCESNLSRSNFSERLYSKSKNLEESELCHWGILGMKWGIRRYQNKDGTLTAEGKKRYAKEQALNRLEEAETALRDASYAMKDYSYDCFHRDINWFKNRLNDKQHAKQDTKYKSRIYTDKSGKLQVEEWGRRYDGAKVKIRYSEDSLAYEIENSSGKKTTEELGVLKFLTGNIDKKPCAVIYQEDPYGIAIGERYRTRLLYDGKSYDVYDDRFGIDVYPGYKKAQDDYIKALENCRELGLKKKPYYSEDWNE